MGDNGADADADADADPSITHERYSFFCGRVCAAAITRCCGKRKVQPPSSAAAAYASASAYKAEQRVKVGMKKVITALLQSPASVGHDLSAPLWLLRLRGWVDQFGSSLLLMSYLLLGMACLLSVFGTNQILADRIKLPFLLTRGSLPTQ